ncbi:TatD family hydrolase [Candidatus Uhrbacteria bacterium]|nr:TatD family hydrolase [Candidatus Uhrbacteria bacterium]
MLIDAHSHVNFNGYKKDADEVIRRAFDQGVAMLAVGSQLSTSERAVDYAERYDGIWAVIGLHPIHLFEQFVDEEEIQFKSRAEEFDPDAYRALAKRSKKVVAIGECGLDYYRLPDGVSQTEVAAKQKEVFRAQLDLSLELGLPIMIHCREAHADVAEILEEYAAAGKSVRGDIHCFTGTVAEAERYLKLGFYISFTGVITFPPRAADRAKGSPLDEVLRTVPLDKLLVETDCPYLAPVPQRGKRNEPAFVRYVAEYAAKVKGVPFEEFAAQTLKNTKQLFSLM